MGIPLVLSQSVAGEVNPPTAMNAYNFYGDTAGKYQINVNVTNQSHELCFAVYQPDGTLTETPLCFAGTNSYSDDVTPTADGTLVVVVWEVGGVGTVNYNVDVSCYFGTCKETTTTKLTSSPNPSADGQAVTFTAVVSSSGGTPPNGETVSFKSGTIVLGTGKLSGGKATFSDSTLTPGATTPVTAVYPGDSNFGSSTSNTVEQVVYGACTLIDTLSYNSTSKTLTMKFTVGNIVATTWNAWLADQNTIQELFSSSQPITNPPTSVTKTTALSPEGTVGVLSTLTTTTRGIFCSSYVQINTGTP